MKALFLIGLIGWVTIPAAYGQWDDSLAFALRRHQPEKVQRSLSRGYPINSTEQQRR